MSEAPPSPPPATAPPDFSSSDDVRDTFTRFFSEKYAHVCWPSARVVPHNDPSLLFINSGMNQFKPIFLGQAPSSTALGQLKRAANSQKCIRAGGKHNDLEDVGKDVYHHTFFEMLGNWSFGDYFKKEAILWAWELLTEVYKIDKNRLYVTYFGGDPREPNCPPDEEARAVWSDLLPADRILPFGMKDNFWEMADTGPCGPCSEIHYDRIGNRDASGLVNLDDPSVLEIWNLVFMQYNREQDRFLTPLPAKCVDTGMGLERLVSVLAGVDSNYSTDLFQPIFTAMQKLIPKLRPYAGKVGSEDADRVDTAYRVVADHIRTLTVAIADGSTPSNEGRGYVLRRILRRAVRYGQQTLGAPRTGGWFYKLVDTVVETLSSAYPELREQPDRVKQVIKTEELQFSVTLDKGVDRFNRLALKLAPSTSVFPGEEAFTLYATFGFPLDLTELMAAEKGMSVNVPMFHKKFEEHQIASDSKAALKGSQDMRLSVDRIAELSDRLSVRPTVESGKYDWCSASGTGPSMTSLVKAIWSGGKGFVNSTVDCDGLCGLIFDKSNFYAEQGGQVADEGFVGSGLREMDEFEVTDVQKMGEYVMHIGTATTGSVAVGEPVELLVDFHRRGLIAKNHTATHVLNFALRKVVENGEAVDQKGSLVDSTKLRFDFNYNGPLPDEKVQQVEDIVNNIIAGSLPVVKVELPFVEAKAIKGLRAVFGEVYPDPVRVVSVGQDVSDGDSQSIEFCGGTHIDNTVEMETFVVISEEGIAKGTRRLVALSGPAATACIAEGEVYVHRYAQIRQIIEGDGKADEVGVESNGGEAGVRTPPLDADRRLVNLRNDIDQKKDATDSLPLLVKKQILQGVEKLRAQLIEIGKKRTKAMLAEAKSLGARLADKFAAMTEDALVLSVPSLNADAKALDTLAQLLRKSVPARKALLLLSSTSGSMASVCLAAPPLVEGGGVVANVWLAEVMESQTASAAGKCGGSATRAAGSSTLKNAQEGNELLTKALKVAEEKGFTVCTQKV
eukprot:GHVS01056494.1.p1 GENE.GHVS01056494.1~~GHVS01056494.1.p1  ORF type:complete len:1066 (+),score=203.45 GHVS01056494.1:157-3198(+)